MRETKRVFVLVKAYPQPSVKYEETVCCAGVTDAGKLIRLYPIRYRRLGKEAKFERYDYIEVQGERPIDDYRPESFHVDEDSIRVLRSAAQTDPRTRASIWLNAVSPSLEALKLANEQNRTSLGIVKPDPESVRFSWKEASGSEEQDREIAAALQYQTSLIEAPLKPLEPPEYAFTYQYTSGERKSKGQIHDWEVQAAYRAYRARYGDEALNMLKRAYQDQMVKQNLHLFLGTMKAHPKQFIIVGLLRFAGDGELQHSLL